ncbi:hypothetical protein AWB69_04943 [Caballeronia udeis]|uniref:Uncharacterized protein n=1 Tax=Caballeronia udeis TaxID=1232866 RepID=A0A158HX36_9BURK|nr:hypothetical protein AWB69_04943 [Caballeronia udeis]
MLGVVDDYSSDYKRLDAVNTAISLSIHLIILIDFYVFLFKSNRGVLVCKANPTGRVISRSFETRRQAQKAAPGFERHRAGVCREAGVQA